jgi:hypothetical protein
MTGPNVTFEDTKDVNRRTDNTMTKRKKTKTNNKSQRNGEKVIDYIRFGRL